MKDGAGEERGDLSGLWTHQGQIFMLKRHEKVYVLVLSSACFSVQGLGTDEEILIEIVCSRSNAELVEIKKVYKESMFGNLVPAIFCKSGTKISDKK